MFWKNFHLYYVNFLRSFYTMSDTYCRLFQPWAQFHKVIFAGLLHTCRCLHDWFLLRIWLCLSFLIRKLPYLSFNILQSAARLFGSSISSEDLISVSGVSLMRLKNLVSPNKRFYVRVLANWLLEENSLHFFAKYIRNLFFLKVKWAFYFCNLEWHLTNKYM